MGVLKNFAIFTEKRLYWSLFFINLQVRIPSLQNISGGGFSIKFSINAQHKKAVLRVLYNKLKFSNSTTWPQFAESSVIVKRTDC